MSFLNPFNWLKRKKDDTSDLEMTVAGTILAADSQRGPTEYEMQKELGTNFHMTESQELMDDLTKLAERRYNFDVKDASGKVIRTEQRMWFHPVFMTLKVEVNRLHSMRWLDPIDAEIAICQVQYNFSKQKMKLTYEEYAQWGGFIDALERLAIEEIHDSVNGRKPRLLKVQERAFEVGFRREKAGERGYSK